MKKKVPIILMLVLSFSCISCFKDNQIAKDEFAKYYNGKDEVAIVDEPYIFFESHTMDFFDIDTRFCLPSTIFYGLRVYYLCTEVDSGWDKNIRQLEFYSCDYNGNDIRLEYVKTLNAESSFICDVANYCCYVKYDKDKNEYIDTYDIITGEYKNIAIGKDCKISDYIEKETSNYECAIIENKSKKQHDHFKIKDKITNEEKIIDDQFLSNTIYIESLQKFSYGPSRADISKGHILLTYAIGPATGIWGYSGGYSHLIFEYNFEEETIEYKALLFTWATNLRMVYVGE